MKEELTKESLLNHISQEEIFEHYLGLPVDTGTHYCNPTREDGSPGCWYWYNSNDKLYFIDNAGKHAGGDCFTMAAKVLGSPDFYTTLRKINQDFKIGLYDGYIQNYDPIPRIAAKPEKITRKRSEIKFTYMPFLPKALEWWSQFCVDEQLLTRFDVFCVYKAWINGNIYHKYTVEDPIYAYKFDSKTKLYRPLNPDLKWRSNCGSDELQGYKQLIETGELLIITKALKDVMTLTNLGFNAVAPQSESSRIPDYYIEELKKRFSRICVFYDNDTAGVVNSVKLTDEIDAEYVNTPKGMPKDPSDFVKEYGCDELAKFLRLKGFH